MSEQQTTDPIQERLAAVEAENATLRQVKAELLAKKSKSNDRVIELEAALAERDGQLTERDATIRQMTVETPLKQFAAQVSNAPELFMEQLAKSYKVELVDGKLSLQTPDGKPVMVEGKPIPFEHQSLLKLLTNEAHPQAATFRAIMVATRASGAASPTRGFGSSATPKKPDTFFGLR
jgi:chromosome segregation ATPase